MPRISKEKIKKIEEQIIHYLYSIFPKSSFTSEIACELARDEEFIKKRLTNLHKSTLIIRIDKNSQGIKYERRNRWRISNRTYEAYKNI